MTELYTLIEEYRDGVSDLSEYAVEKCNNCHGKGTYRDPFSGDWYCECTDKKIATKVMEDLQWEYDKL